MAAQAAVYLPSDEVDLRRVFPDATSNKTLFRKATHFEVKLNGEAVRFNVMPKQEVAPHLTGLKGYVASLAPPEEQRALLDQHINLTRTVLGLVAQSDFEDNPAIWDALFRIAREFQGFVFAYNSVILSNRVPLVGPLREKSASDDESAGADVDDEDDQDEEDDEDEELTPPTPERVAQRALVMAAVVCRGFIEADAGQAPAEEFRKRVVDWVEELGLDSELEPHERELLQTPLGEADPRAVINATWSSEGMAVLAWALDWSELPAYDESVAPMEVAQQSGFLAEDALDAVVEAELLPAEEIHALQASMLTAHWRLRQFGLLPEHIDFADFVKTAWWGPLSLEGLRLVDGDLAIGDVAISHATDEERSRCASIALERHRALNWLAGWDEVYSEVDTST